MDEDEAEPAVPSDGVWNPQTTPPLAAKTEEKVRGNVFKVSAACLRGTYLHTLLHGCNDAFWEFVHSVFQNRETPFAGCELLFWSWYYINQ